MEYEIGNEEIVLLVSSKGAQMMSILHEGIEYLWQGDRRYWEDRAPNLFPYVGRFTKGKYKYHGKEYEMDIHGFAKDSVFDMVEQSENRLVFLLEDSTQTYESYPFHFQFYVAYVLKGNTVEVTYKVRNLSENIMYFGLGGHPGFRVPLEEDLDFSEYYLEFSQICQPDRIGHTPACFLNGQNAPYPLEAGCRIALDHNMFHEDAIVLQNMDSQVTLCSKKGSRKVIVKYPHLPYLGIWHMPHTDAPYVCIEPWTSLPSRQDMIEEISAKTDMVRLPAGESYHNTWSITAV